MCIFPMGSIFKDNQWHVSCGINDTYNCIITMTDKQVKDSLVSSDEFKEPQIKYYLCQGRQVAYKTLSGASNTWKLIGISGRRGMTGVISTTDPFTVKDMEGKLGVTEITKEEYESHLDSLLPKKNRTNGNVFENLKLDNNNGLSILR